MISAVRAFSMSLVQGRRGQLWIIAALFLLLIALAVVQGAPQVEQPYDLTSRGPQGLLALRLWLAEMGYPIAETGALRFELPPAAGMLWVYPGERPYSAVDAAIVRRWVEQGGTLVLVGPAAQDEALADAFGVTAASAPAFSAQVRQVQPLLPDAPAAWPLLQAGSPLELDQAAGAVVALAMDDGRPTAAAQPVGRGVVWHLSPLHSLVNAELRSPDQAALAMALLRNVPDGGLVVFDTYHLRSQPATAPSIGSLRDWLYRSPAGQGVLLAAFFVIGYLLLQGRRLGPPLPNLAETRRREAAEYVRAMAALYRRSHQRSAIARHQKRRLKQGLGRPLRIDPDLPDDEFVARLAQSAHRFNERDAGLIHGLFQRLDRDNDERDLVLAAQEIDRLLAHAAPAASPRMTR